MTVNHKIGYKSYCKYSLLYEAVMGRTKDLNQVTKSFILSLFMLLESSRHCKPCGLQQRLHLPCHQCCCFERPDSMWETENHPTRWQTALPDCQNQQVFVSHPTLPKVELCFGAKSLYCNHLSLSPGDAANLQQSSCLTTSTS